MKINRKIAINATILHDKPSGLGVYTYELIVELLKNSSEIDFKVFSGLKSLKNSYPDEVCLVSNRTSPNLGLKGHLMRLLWQQTVLPIKLKQQKIPLIYSSVPEGIMLPCAKQVITIHDLIPLKFPKLFPKLKYHYHYNLPRLLKYSQAVICDSENTKKDVGEIYDLSDKPTYVIHAGLSQKKFHPQVSGIIEEKYGFRNYLLYVGDLRPYKNLERSIEAFSLLRLKDFKFIIIGKKDERFYPALQKKVDALFLRDKVIFMGYISDEDLPSFYSESTALVFPSLYEGFGLPLLEAMACGCPVITSNLSSLPEVSGDSALYVDAYSSKSIAAGISSMVTNPQQRDFFKKKGFKRAKRFSWEKTAREVLEVCSSIVT